MKLLRSRAFVIILFWFLRLRNALNPAEYLHEFLTGDCLLVNEERGDLVHGILVIAQEANGLIVGILQYLHDLLVNLGCCCVAAV